MAIVQIVNGTYGYRPDGSNYVVPVTPRDLPISVSDEEAKRLVDLGVAVYVGEGAVATAPSPDSDACPISNSPSDEDGESGDSDPAEGAVPDIETLKGMKMEDLRAMAENLGIESAGSAKKKSELIEAISEAASVPSVEDVVE